MKRVKPSCPRFPRRRPRQRPARQIPRSPRSPRPPVIVDHDLPPVVFHSLRHYSTSLKLQLSKDNIKAVQGDTGHAQARMVTDLYVHADTEARRKLAQKVEQDFFRQKDAKTEKAADDDAQRTYQLLQTNPEIAKLILSIMGQSAS